MALVVVFVLFLLGGVASASRIGVGISTGKISLNQGLKPGLTYRLPKIAVFNNGDVSSDYEMTVQFNEKQSQLKPAANWVHFSPQHFSLEPGKARQISMTIRASSSARPGNYFAYIEARPLKKDKSGKTAINIAAASKFSFKVVTTNIFQKLYYFWIDLWNKYKQVIIPLTLIVVAAASLTYSRRKLNIVVSKKKPTKSKASRKNK